MRSWYACEEPEKPTDPYVVWHYLDMRYPGPCAGCSIKATLLRHLYPNDPHVRWLCGVVGGDKGEVR